MARWGLDPSLYMASGYVIDRDFQELVNLCRNSSDNNEVAYSIQQLSSLVPKHKPNTCNLEKSEFALRTKMASGLGAFKRKRPGNNVLQMTLAREHGALLSNNFSYVDKCKLNNKFLPNGMSVLQKQNGKVFCGIFSKDGGYFLTASQDHQINIYNTQTFKYQRINQIHARDIGWSILDVAFSPNGEHFVYTSWHPSIQLCSIHDKDGKQETLDLSDIDKRICAFSVVFSTSGDEVLASSNDGCIYGYNLEKQKCHLKVTAHQFDVNSIALASESSQVIYSGADDGLIKVWDRRALDANAPKPVGIFAGHIDGITYIDSRDDGRYLISNSKDQSIKLWDIRAFAPSKYIRYSPRITSENRWDYRWQNVPRRLYKEKKIESDTSLMTYRGHVVIKTLIRSKFSPVATTGQRYIYTGCGFGRIVIYDALTGQIVKGLGGHNATVRDVSWHPYRNEIVSSSWDGKIGYWKYSPATHNYDDDSKVNERDLPKRPRNR